VLPELMQTGPEKKKKKEPEVFPTDFRKVPEYQISRISVRLEPISLWTDGRTDRLTDRRIHMTKLLFAFRLYPNPPNNILSCSVVLLLYFVSLGSHPDFRNYMKPYCID
jgi:hypothetical protein